MRTSSRGGGRSPMRAPEEGSGDVAKPPRANLGPSAQPRTASDTEPCPTNSTSLSGEDVPPREGSSASGGSPVTAGMTMRLSDAHRAALLRSGVGVEQVGQRAYWTATRATELEQLGFSKPQRRVPALVVPIWGVTGEIASYQIRPDTPRVINGKAVKYETPKGTRIVVDVPPGARPRLHDPATPLFVTEGAKKADAAVGRGMCCIDLLGVWNWRGTNDDGGLTSLADWELVALKHRTVYVVFDSDVTTKPAVHGALTRLKAFLELRGAEVFVVYLPSEADGGKVGLDDFLAKGNGADAVVRLARSEVVAPARDDAGGTPYEITRDGIFLRRASPAGVERVPVANFSARILRELTLDDGASSSKRFELVATVGPRQVSFDLPAEEFARMTWPVPRVGAGATVFSVRGAAEHVRAAIQLDSGVDAERVTVYTHTGWREIEGGWVYLHGGGALGARGPVATASVRLPPSLSDFVLPAPEDGDRLRECVRASLSLLELGASLVSRVLFAAAFRAPIDTADFAVYLHGRTGTFKTALAALTQQFFGATMDDRHLPGSWLSTANSLESAAHHAKDAIFVIDDFAPTGGPGGMDRMQATLDRVLRAVGNQAGRSRCAVDGSLRPERHPRGVLVCTGEEVPRAASALARVLLVESLPGDVDTARLTRAQALARDGEYGRAMASYIRWLAARLPAIRDERAGWVARRRDELARSGQHRRAPGAVAELLFGVEVFLRFAADAGALDDDERGTLRDRMEADLRALLDAQGSQMEVAEPHVRFLSLLRSALAAGDAHVVAGDGSRPDDPGRWGWRPSASAEGTSSNALWLPQGRAVGWIVGEDLYLDTSNAVRAAQGVAALSGNPLEISPGTISRRLRDGGLLASVDSDGKHIEVQRVLSGIRRRVLHLRTASFVGTEAGESEDAFGSFAPCAGSEPPILKPPPRAVPNGPCFACGGDDWWRTEFGQSRCRTCHPPVAGAEVTP